MSIRPLVSTPFPVPVLGIDFKSCTRKARSFLSTHSGLDVTILLSQDTFISYSPVNEDCLCICFYISVWQCKCQHGIQNPGELFLPSVNGHLCWSYQTQYRTAQWCGASGLVWYSDITWKLEVRSFVQDFNFVCKVLHNIRWGGDRKKGWVDVWGSLIFRFPGASWEIWLQEIQNFLSISMES